jgi:hypothetical protein
VNDTGNETQDCQEDVDEEIGTASALEEYTKRWQDDGEDDLADIAGECELLLDQLFAWEA